MRVFSGMRPTAQLHLGNYLGSLKQWLGLQEKHECLFCVVDLHAITTPFSPSQLKKDIYSLTRAYLACGLDPQKSVIFLQSLVPEHTELAWILGCLTPVGELFRMTQYKEKSQEIEQGHKGFVGAGLLNYPLLMASDILLYQTDIVPVGLDQKQHLELTRETARRFNKKYGKTFKLPKPYIPKLGAKIMSLVEPHKKMSKTGNPKGVLFLFDTEKELREKIMRAVTDSEKEIRYDPDKKPGISNLLVILSALTNTKITLLEKRFAGAGYKELKEEVAREVIKAFKPFREAQKRITNNQIESILKRGARKARKIATPTIERVRKKIGIGLLG